MILAAVVAGPMSDDLVQRVVTAKSYYRPHSAMLMLADRILNRRTSLVDLAQCRPAPASTDAWGPAAIPLTERERSPFHSEGT
jgi:predicted protein tyrosine phosphatase